MLRTDDWSFYEGYSEVDGNIVMRFYGQVDRNNPDNIVITEKEESEDSYRKNVQVVRQDRRTFEDRVYFEASRLSGLNQMVKQADNVIDEPNCVSVSHNSETPEGGVFNEV